MEAATAPAIMVEWISFYLFLFLIGALGFLLLFSAPAGCRGGANDFGIVIRSNVGAGGELHRCAYSIVGQCFSCRSRNNNSRHFDDFPPKLFLSFSVGTTHVSGFWQSVASVCTRVHM